MKKVISILFLTVFAFTVSAQQSHDLDWLTDFDKAVKISKKENKPILLYFTGSDWCSPCKMLKVDLFDSDDFRKRAENMVLVKADFPRNKDLISKTERIQNNELLGQYNTRGSFPTMVLVNSRGKKLGSISGYNMMRDTKRHFDFIDHGLSRY